MITLIFIRKLIARNYHVELLCAEESRMQIEANNLGIIIHPVKAANDCAFSAAVFAASRPEVPPPTTMRSNLWAIEHFRKL